MPGSTSGSDGEGVGGGGGGGGGGATPGSARRPQSARDARENRRRSGDVPASPSRPSTSGPSASSGYDQPRDHNRPPAKPPLDVKAIKDLIDREAERALTQREGEEEGKRIDAKRIAVMEEKELNIKERDNLELRRLGLADVCTTRRLMCIAPSS